MTGKYCPTCATRLERRTNPTGMTVQLYCPECVNDD